MPVDKVTFSLKFNVEQDTEVDANNHLLGLNILSIKYSMYDVKCDVNYCMYTKEYLSRVAAREETNRYDGVPNLH